jgi:tetratricopeptide (TPR) repeat protein
MSRALKCALVLALALAFCANRPLLADRAFGAFNKGKRAYLQKDYVTAEKYFKAVTEKTPDDIMGHLYLAHSLYYQQKFKEAIPEYRKSRDLNAKTGALDKLNGRIVNDNLGMAYGMTGQLSEAKNVFEEAIERDPDYPMYHYNLACVFAEKGDIDQALVFLRSAYQRKANLVAGETIPNPRNDGSFKRYAEDATFAQALKELGL